MTEEGLSQAPVLGSSILLLASWICTHDGGSLSLGLPSTFHATKWTLKKVY